MQSTCSFSPFLPMSRDWSQQLVRAVSCAPSSLFCLLLPEGFVSFARPRCTLWTVAVSILLQQETQQLLANATLKLNQRPFFKIKQETAVKSCENLWNRTPPKLNKYFCLCECVTLHTLACFLLLTKQDSLTGSALVISTEFVGECSFSKVGNFVICANLCVSIFGTDALFAVIHFPCRLDFHKNYSWW